VNKKQGGRKRGREGRWEGGREGRTFMPFAMKVERGDESSTCDVKE